MLYYFVGQINQPRVRPYLWHERPLLERNVNMRMVKNVAMMLFVGLIFGTIGMRPNPTPLEQGLLELQFGIGIATQEEWATEEEVNQLQESCNDLIREYEELQKFKKNLDKWEVDVPKQITERINDLPTVAAETGSQISVARAKAATATRKVKKLLKVVEAPSPVIDIWGKREKILPFNYEAGTLPKEFLICGGYPTE